CWKSGRALPSYKTGLLLLRLGHDAETLASLEESLRIYPTHKNPAALRLLQYYSERAHRLAFLDIGNRFFRGRVLDLATMQARRHLSARLGTGVAGSTDA